MFAKKRYCLAADSVLLPARIILRLLLRYRVRLRAGEQKQEDPSVSRERRPAGCCCSSQGLQSLPGARLGQGHRQNKEGGRLSPQETQQSLASRKEHAPANLSVR